MFTREVDESFSKISSNQQKIIDKNEKWKEKPKDVLCIEVNTS